MIVFHHNDADGRCSAAIAWYGTGADLRCRFVEMDYAKRVPVEEIACDETVIIVDFSFKPAVMAEVFERTLDVTWIDHHATAADYDYGRGLKGLRDFSDKGPAACELAFRYYFPNLTVPRGVVLLGDYDSWRLEQVPRTFWFYEGLKLCDQKPKSLTWKGIIEGDGGAINTVMEKGINAVEYRDNYCGDMVRSYGYETVIDGHSAFACNIYRFGSQGFGETFKRYPICLSYVHDGRKFTVSLYSEAVNVSEIAKAHGGGGHKGAAGFTCMALPFTPSCTTKRDCRGT